MQFGKGYEIEFDELLEDFFRCFLGDFDGNLKKICGQKLKNFDIF